MVAQFLFQDLGNCHSATFINSSAAAMFGCFYHVEQGELDCHGNKQNSLFFFFNTSSPFFPIHVEVF